MVGNFCIDVVNKNFSRAICQYLADKYGKSDSLYPKDPKQRAVVNQRLYFDMGSLYQSFADYFVSIIRGLSMTSTVKQKVIIIYTKLFQYPQVFAGAPADPAKLEKVNDALGYLEKFLDGHNYVAGNNLTIADLVIATTFSNFAVLQQHPFSIMLMRLL